MKKVLILLIMTLILSGCSRSGETAVNEETFEETQSGDGVRTYQKEFGSYEVVEGWVESDRYSSAGQTFYIQKGHENDEKPDNIAIVSGNNRYEADEHEAFREAVLSQLMQQIEGTDGVSLTGDGSSTDKGYIVYTFTVEEVDTGIKTVQYYIVGDRRYCLIHETNFSGSEAVDRASEWMVDSFIWSE